MTPDEWFALRGDWLLNVGVAQTPNGYDVVSVQVDGSYADRGDAERAAEKHRREIAELVARSRKRGGSDVA